MRYDSGNFQEKHMHRQEFVKQGAYREKQSDGTTLDNMSKKMLKAGRRDIQRLLKGFKL